MTHLKLVKNDGVLSEIDFDKPEIVVSPCDCCDGADIRIFFRATQDMLENPIFSMFMNIKDGKYQVGKVHIKFNLWHKIIGRERAVKKVIRSIQKGLEKKNHNIDWLAKI
jgi:hypothetical protein